MTKERYELVRNELGFYSVAPLPSAEDQKSFYQKKYYQEGHGHYRKDYDPEELEYILGPARVAEHITRSIMGIETGRVLDAGCGQGYFASFFAGKGWEVLATDFSAHGLQSHNPRLKEFFKQGDLEETLEDLKYRKERFHLINLNGVLEHLIDPAKVLSLARGLLIQGGVLRVAVPNDYSDFQKMLLKRGATDESWFVPPEHLHYFSFASLKALVSSCGFSVRQVMGDFPIELFLLNEHSNYNLDQSKGKAAHRARIATENFLLSRGLDAYIAYCEATARVSMGRQVIVFATI